MIFIAPCVHAGRPLITDDDGVVSARHFQLETWGFADKRSFQHWVVPTVGIGDIVEVSASFVHGYSFIKDYQRVYSFSGPITQAKFKIQEGELRGRPGLAIAGGVIPSFGSGFFKTPKWEYYSYMAFSFLPDEKWPIHLNLGRQTRRQLQNSHSALLWGLAIEHALSNDDWLFIEGTNGEIYTIIPGTALQAGFRKEMRKGLQLDGTVGRGVSGSVRLPFWVTLGIKHVSEF